MPNLKLTERRHALGAATIYAVSEDEFLIVDAYEDQFSINWSTRIGFPEFIAGLRYAGADKAPALLVTQSAERQPIDGYGYQVFGLLAEAPTQFSQLKTTLVRFWLDELSVAWQLLPSSRGDVTQIVGLAGPYLDIDATAQYFMETATHALQRAMRKEFSSVLERLTYPRLSLYQLRQAEFGAEGKH